MTSRSDSSQSQTHVSASDIEREVQRRLEFATERYKREISDLRETIKVLEFRAAVAEWAVSGVLARNLSLRVAIDPNAREQATVDLARAVGGNAGHQFLHAAELQFKLHAEHSALKANAGIHYRHTVEESLPAPIFWPRPFK